MQGPFSVRLCMKAGEQRRPGLRQDCPLSVCARKRDAVRTFLEEDGKSPASGNEDGPFGA